MLTPQLSSFRIVEESAPDFTDGPGPTATNRDRLIVGTMTLPASPTAFDLDAPSDPLQSLMKSPNDSLRNWIKNGTIPTSGRILSTDRPLLIADYRAAQSMAELAEPNIRIAAFAETNIVTLTLPAIASLETQELPEYWQRLLQMRSRQSNEVFTFRRDGNEAFGHLKLGQSEMEILTMHYALLRNPTGIVQLLQNLPFKDLDNPDAGANPAPRVRLAPLGELRVMFEPRENVPSKLRAEMASCSKVVYVYDGNGIVIRTIVLGPWPVG